MAVMRTYWSRALKPPLADVHLATQTLPLSKHDGARNMGLDMPVENLNRDIKADAERSEEGVKAYCERRDFIAAVGDGVNSLIYADRSELKDALRKKIDNDVGRLKEFFRANIGATWAEATRPRATSAIGLKDRPGLVRTWEAMRPNMYQSGTGHYLEWVKGHVRDKAPWHKWYVPQPAWLPPLYSAVSC
jgi:hypothetical protein